MLRLPRQEASGGVPSELPLRAEPALRAGVLSPISRSSPLPGRGRESGRGGVASCPAASAGPVCPLPRFE